MPPINVQRLSLARARQISLSLMHPLLIFFFLTLRPRVEYGCKYALWGYRKSDVIEFSFHHLIYDMTEQLKVIDLNCWRRVCASVYWVGVGLYCKIVSTRERWRKMIFFFNFFMQKSGPICGFQVRYCQTRVWRMLGSNEGYMSTNKQAKSICEFYIVRDNAYVKLNDICYTIMIKKYLSINHQCCKKRKVNWPTLYPLTEIRASVKFVTSRVRTWEILFFAMLFCAKPRYCLRRLYVYLYLISSTVFFFSYTS